MPIAYLTNQYPKVSHSFIRREILALEAAGVPVARFSIRSCEGELVDAVDLAEVKKTTVILQQGVGQFLGSTLACLGANPIAFLQTGGLALRLGYRSDAGWLKHVAYFIEACTLHQNLKRLGIRHIHTHFGTNPATVALLCSQLGDITYSFTVHGPEEFDKPGGIALAEKINHAQWVFGISSFTRSQLYRWCDLADWPKIQVVRCGLDDQFLTAEITPPPATPQLVCVGRLCEQKGQLLLIEAAKQLADQGYAFRLVLVGDGPMRGQVEALIEQYQLQERVTITGWASSQEVSQYIQDSRALVLPSFAEGLPVVIMEALALGRPVISTYVAGIPELVEPGRCGWLVPSGSVSHLVEAIAAALTASPETLAAMGQYGATKARTEHNSHAIAAQIAGLLQPQVGTAATDPTRPPREAAGQPG